MKDFMDFSGALDGEDPTISQGADSFTTGTDYNGDGIMDGEAVYEDRMETACSYHYRIGRYK